jgi:ABC-type sugar transport system permease subunit
MKRSGRSSFPLLSPTTFFLLVVNIVYAFFDTFGIIDAVTGGGPAKATETLVYKVYYDGAIAEPRRSAAQRDPDGDRDRADRRAVPLRRAQGALLMLDSPITAAVGRRSNWVPHAVLWIGVFITAFPLYVTSLPQRCRRTSRRCRCSCFPAHGWDNYREAWSKGSAGTYLSPPAATLLLNSLIVALVVTFGKISVSLLSAYAVVFFKFPGRMIFFWMIFITLMLPVEVRILPTYQVVTDLKLINSYAGLTSCRSSRRRRQRCCSGSSSDHPRRAGRSRQN